MVAIPEETWKNSGFKTAVFNNLTENRKQFWLKMRNIQVKLVVKNIANFVRKNLNDVFNTKNPTKKEI